MAKISAGQEVRDFSLPCTDGTVVSPLTFRGKWTILYFYPKDDTSGCTKEACGFRDAWKEYEKRKVLVYGMSADSIESHKKFIGTYDLPFPLLSDESTDVLDDFGVWQQKSMSGKDYMGIVRTTLIVDPDGRIAKIFDNVKPDEHSKEILSYLDVVMANWSL